MTNDAASLNQAARRAMGAGDFATAQAILLQAVGRDRTSIPSWLNLAATRRHLNDVNGAFDALREVLKLDPRNFHALLMNATLLERTGQLREAAAGYGIALTQAPPEQYLDLATRQTVAHAREVHGQHTRELHDFIHAEIASEDGQCAPAERRRIESFVATTARTGKRYQQQPLEYFYPGLPAIEFYEREQFPWLSELEAATGAMQTELAQILREDSGGFAPYIHYDDHLPLDQWRDLNHSLRWSAFHFYERGEPIEERCRRAPATMAALSKLPQPKVRLRSPSALFSVLQPRTRIPPHTGIANFRLVAHLPLIVPPGCGFRVGGETRQWRVGEAWVFDDTIEHEAWNDSDETRIIFICDVWNPRLSPTERILIDRVITATDAFNGTQPSSSI